MKINQPTKANEARCINIALINLEFNHNTIESSLGVTGSTGLNDVLIKTTVEGIKRQKFVTMLSCDLFAIK